MSKREMTREELLAENKRLRDAIADIDAHAVALAEDKEGFVAMGYVISVGALHRALGVVGGSYGVNPIRKVMTYDERQGIPPEAVGEAIGRNTVTEALAEIDALNDYRPALKAESDS